ncbi:hypothetical protein WN72_10260 [Bradyrhizobium arachidis]|uniref:Uncharacterized protein n=1 Tax=Bradyrhizobium arachidis TaxID=858423 RepID=A0AAE7NKK4_9BRAD|nr:hypothetical protein WN72_10260 [Bradyrhizobium arachidis]
MSAALDERSLGSEFGLINPARATLARILESHRVREGRSAERSNCRDDWETYLGFAPAKALNDRCRPAEELHVGIIWTLDLVIAIAIAVCHGV